MDYKNQRIELARRPDGVPTRQDFRFIEEGVKQLAGWLLNKKLAYKETIEEGFEQIPAAFIGLFSGENLGKQLVKVDSE